MLELRGEGATAGYSGADLRLVELYGEVRRRGLADVFPAALAAPYLAAVKQLVAFGNEVCRKRALGGRFPSPDPRSRVPRSSWASGSWSPCGPS